MEVVKEGRKQGGWAEKFRCTGDGNGGGGCGATLLVSQVDLYETTLDSVDESELCKTFCCQQCGVETDVEVPVVLPSEVADESSVEVVEDPVVEDEPLVGVPLPSVSFWDRLFVRVKGWFS